MSLNSIANTVYFSGRFRAELSVALAAEEQRRQEPSYHFDNAISDFGDLAGEMVDHMLGQLRTDMPELPKRARVSKMNPEQTATRLRVLESLFGKESAQVVAQST